MKYIALVIMVLALMVPVSAETVDANLEAEVAVMATTRGAAYRFAQLEASIDRTLSGMETIIERAESQNIDAEALLDIKFEMELLGEQVASVEFESLTLAEAAAEFVALRREASVIVSEFRETARSLFDANAQAELRAEVAVNARARAEVAQRVVSERCLLNAERVQTLAEQFGIEENLSRRVASCEVNWEDAVARLRTQYAQMNAEARARTRAEVSETISRDRVQQIEIRNEAILRAEETREARAKERLALVRTLPEGSRVESRIATRIDVTARERDARISADTETDAEAQRREEEARRLRAEEERRMQAELEAREQRESEQRIESETSVRVDSETREDRENSDAEEERTATIDVNARTGVTTR